MKLNAETKPYVILKHNVYVRPLYIRGSPVVSPTWLLKIVNGLSAQGVPLD